MTTSADGGRCPADVFIVGAGVQVPAHLTSAAIDALDQCQEIYSILPQSTSRLMPSRWASKTRDLQEIYQRGGRRLDVYRKEIDLIWQAARSNPPVAYLTVGNPVVFDSVTAGLIERAKCGDMRVRVVAGVSSVDAIMADLGIDYAPGIQIFDASSLVAHNIQPRNDIDCLVMQPNVFGTAFVTMGRKPRAAALWPLRDHLLKCYPSDHTVTCITCSVRSGNPAHVESFPLSCLGGTEMSPQTLGASLFIPAAVPLKPDEDFSDRFRDQSEFERNYR
ncbi:SAM-dependent methyltransferase [Streptomyces capillispiralis]|uniref:Tetrapyrrole (Corrin/porphyrin) methylase-like protein n=1 Tax=Streptomyces capillispiralis TaxID=68182 RepID=A0A561TQ37_9ACTN|nr:SAM-dependent methyltransferase [Streptomyces capillispiralis]TWF89221.1 tetrapyrrole (corrin/porphyrin) methylase-like protein [Streptomyces capillispiralis]